MTVHHPYLQKGHAGAPPSSLSNRLESSRRMRAVKILAFSSARCPAVTVVAAGKIVFRQSCTQVKAVRLSCKT